MEHQILIRRDIPHKYDHAPQGTRCSVIKDNKIVAIYEQKSSDEENPRWELIQEQK